VKLQGPPITVLANGMAVQVLPDFVSMDGVDGGAGGGFGGGGAADFTPGPNRNEGVCAVPST